jgi:hypothetical protein
MVSAGAQRVVMVGLVKNRKVRVTQGSVFKWRNNARASSKDTSLPSLSKTRALIVFVTWICVEGEGVGCAGIGKDSG